MSALTLNGVVTDSLIRRFQGAASGSSTSSIAKALSGDSSSTSISAGLRTGARSFGQAVQGLNALTSYLNISRATLERLGEITDDLIDVTKRASSSYLSSSSRATLDREFKKLGKDFQELRDSAKSGDRQLLSADGLAELFVSVGLDRGTSDTIAALFKNFVLTDEDASLASEYEKGRRPSPIPAAAYRTRVLTPASVVGDGTFTSSDTLATPGASGTHATIADVNGDSAADLLAVDSASASLQVHSNNGAGSYNAAVSYGLTGAPGVAVHEDFDGDSTRDIAVINAGGYIEVLSGNADGSFAAASVYNLSLGAIGKDLKAADLDGDDDLDLIATRQDDSTLEVLLNNGDGSFKASVNYLINGLNISLADFDGDSNIDVVSVGSGSDLNVALGAGDGTFGAATAYDLGGAPVTGQAIASADVNGDSIQDVVVGYDANLKTFIGNGDGSFNAALSTTVATAVANDLRVEDVNGDQYADVLLAGTDGGVSRVLTAKLGNGDGTFRADLSYTAAGAYSHLAVGDVDNDGVSDVVANNSLSSQLEVFIGGQSSANPGSFQATRRVEGSLGTLSDLQTADFNADGYADYVGVDAANNVLRVALGNGDGSFTGTVSIAVQASPVALGIGDFDDDSTLDIVSLDSAGNISVALGTGAGAFAAALSYAAPVGADALATGDFDGDGRDDVAIADSSLGVTTLLFSNQDGSFKASTTRAGLADGVDIVSADLNNDGNIDYFETSAASSVGTVRLGNGDGSFKTAITVSTEGTNAGNQLSSPTDLNGDGALDLLGVNNSNALWYALNNGDGTFEATKTFTASATGNAYRATTADFDLDGYQDIALSQNGEGKNYVFFNNGDATFRNAASYSTFGPASKQVISGDFNQDGFADLLTAQTEGTGDSVALLRNNANGTLTEGSLSGSTREFESIFDTERNIRRRPDAFKMLFDLQALRKQIDGNLKAIDQAVEIVGKNIDLVRAAGFAFLNLSDQLTGAEEASVVAERLRQAIRQDAKGALAQIENLEPLAVAALTREAASTDS